MDEADVAEVLVSVDIETSGQSPSVGSMLSIGACLVDDPSRTFECELKPITDKAVPAALEVSGLSLERLRETGIDPAAAMARFGDWITDVAGDAEPVFVGFV